MYCTRHWTLSCEVYKGNALLEVCSKGHTLYGHALIYFIFRGDNHDKPKSRIRKAAFLQADKESDFERHPTGEF